MSTYPVVDLNQSKPSPAPLMTPTPANPANRNDPTNTATQSNDTGSPYPSYTLQEFEEEEAKIKSMPSWPPKIRAKFKNTHPYVEKIGSISRRITYGIKGAETCTSPQSKSDLKYTTMPFSSTVFHALSFGMIHFGWCVCNRII